MPVFRVNDERNALKDLVTQKKALVSQGTADLEAERLGVDGDARAVTGQIGQIAPVMADGHG